MLDITFPSMLRSAVSVLDTTALGPCLGRCLLRYPPSLDGVAPGYALGPGVLGDRLFAGDALPSYQIIVDQPALMGASPFLVQLGLGALALGHRVRQPSSVFGFLG